MASEKTTFLEEGLGIIDEAEKNSILLRLLGSTAIRYHCKNNAHVLEQMKRELTDIDVASYSKFRQKLLDFLPKRGYMPDRHFNSIQAVGGYARLKFANERGLTLDIFLDRLDFCHVVPLSRLELDRPTIPLAELLLEKMQIVNLTEKDIKDTVVLLLEHDIGDTDRDIINGSYIAQLLSSDWGFYHTVTSNLGNMKAHVPGFSMLSQEQKDLVVHRTNQLLKQVEDKPKSFKWKARARIGTKKKWYNDVEELHKTLVTD